MSSIHTITLRDRKREALAKEPLALRRTRFKLVVDYPLLEIVPRLQELGYTDIETFAAPTSVEEMHVRLNAFATGRDVDRPVLLITRNYEGFEGIVGWCFTARYSVLWAREKYPAAKIPAKIDTMVQHEAVWLCRSGKYDLALEK